MFELGRLPPEILRLILNDPICSFMVIQLWKCGNKIFNHRLATGGCTEVVLKDHVANSTSRFPKMLRSLRELRSLSISRPYSPLMPTNILIEEVRALSPTLEKLELLLDAALPIFLQEPKTYSSTRWIMTSYARGQSRFWNIATTFPNLKSFSLVDCSRRAIQEGDLAALPAGITELTVGCEASKIMSRLREFFTSLPPSLTKVNLPLPLPVNTAELSLLPASVTDLRLDALSLILNRPEEERDPTTSTYHFNLSKLLHPALSRLSIGSIDHASFPSELSSWSATLPRNLTELVISNPSNISRPIAHFKVSDLPRTLKVLCYAYPCFWNSIEVSEHLDRETVLRLWPPSLQVLELPELDNKSGLTNPEKLSILPASLTKLTISASIFPTFDLTGLLPPKLVYLNWSDTCDTQSPTSTSSLKGLTTKDLKTLITTYISSDRLSELSSNLTHLTLHKSSLTIFSNLSYLPPSLTSLEVGEANWSHFALVPSQIRSFTCRVLSGAVVNAFGDLPKGLTSLIIGKSWAPPPQLFHHLPRQLALLHIETEPHVEASVLGYLPRSLTSLEITLNDSTVHNIKSMPHEKLVHFKPTTYHDFHDEEILAYWPEKVSEYYGFSRGSVTRKRLQDIQRNSQYPDPRLLASLTSKSEHQQ